MLERRSNPEDAVAADGNDSGRPAGGRMPEYRLAGRYSSIGVLGLRFAPSADCHETSADVTDARTIFIKLSSERPLKFVEARKVSSN